MNKNFKLLAMVSVFTLAACGSDENKSYEAEAEKAAEASNDAVDDTAGGAEAKASELLDKAKAAAGDIKEKAGDVTNAVLKLDASSLDSFKSSITNMRALLPEAKQSELAGAIAKLAKSAVSDGNEGTGGLLDKAKSLSDGKSAQDLVYEKLGSQMDGMTFDDILKFADSK